MSQPPGYGPPGPTPAGSDWLGLGESPQQGYPEQGYPEQGYPEQGYSTRIGPPLTGGQQWPGRPRPRRRRRWPDLVVLAALVIAAAVVLLVIHRGHHQMSSAGAGASTGMSGTPSASAMPSTPAMQQAVTMATAQQVLAHFTSVNNTANKAYSNSLLATVEGGSSYRIDTGAYRFQQATDPTASKYAPLDVKGLAYYIPNEPANGYPKWFAARVEYVTAATGQTLSTGYIVFAQQSQGAPWLDVSEPVTTAPGGPSMPSPIATPAEGTVTGSTGTSGEVERQTIGLLDAGRLQVPGTLADQGDERYWAMHDPSVAVTDTHSLTSYPVYSLRTANGGQLLFFALKATLSLRPPSGETFTISVPGYYSPSDGQLSSARMVYGEQFAAYVPPSGSGGATIVAADSSIVARG